MPFVRQEGWTIALALSFCATLAPTRVSADPARFVALPDIPGGHIWSRAYAISGDGSVVVGQSSSMFHPSYPDENVSEAAVWPSTHAVTGIGFAGVGAGFLGSRAFGVSGDGLVVVGETSTPTKSQAAFRWTAEGGVVVLEDLPGVSSKAESVSADGSVVVGSTYSVPVGEGFRWTIETGLVRLGAGTIATDISADGSIIVGASNGRAVLWTDDGATMIPLGAAPPAGTTTFAEGVSPDGSVVVGRRNGAQPTAWIWTAAGGMEDLDAPLGTTGSNAYDVSNGGEVVVGFASSATAFATAVIWDRVHGRRDLKAVLQTDHGMDLSDWHLLYALGISDDGRFFVGYGVGADGNGAWFAGLATCNDGIDNDADGLVDFSEDPGCTSSDDTDEGPDTDRDGIPDASDKCTLVANENQLDTDGDGFGNACDPDYDQNSLVGLSDFDHLRSQFGKTSADPGFDPGADANGDGAIGLPDFNALRSRFGMGPGPAGPLP